MTTWRQSSTLRAELYGRLWPGPPQFYPSGWKQSIAGAGFFSASPSLPQLA